MAVAYKNRKDLWIGNLNHSFFPLLRSTSLILYLKLNYLGIVSGVKKIYLTFMLKSNTYSTVKMQESLAFIWHLVTKQNMCETLLVEYP